METEEDVHLILDPTASSIPLAMAEHVENAALYQPYSLSSAGSSPREQGRVDEVAPSEVAPASSLHLADTAEGTDIIVPLKGALDATKSALDDIQAIDDNQEEWNDLAQYLTHYMTTIESQVAYLEKYPEAERTVDEAFCNSLAPYVELLENFHDRVSNHKRRRSRLGAFTTMTKVKLDAATIRKFSRDLEHQHNQFMHSLSLFTGRRLQIIKQSAKASLSNVDINAVLQLPMVASVASSVHSTCLPGTRHAVLQTISKWAEDVTSRTPIFWLCDIAGSGKSTVAMSIAERWQMQRVLGAQFFFSLGSGETSSTDKFWSTVARELVHRMPELAPHIAEAVKRNSAIMRSPVRDQLQELVINPLRHRKDRVLLLIDAVDECKSAAQKQELLETLIVAVRGCRDLKIFITSRPDPVVESVLGPLMFKVAMKDSLHNVENRDNMDDIATYVHQSLDGVLSPEKRGRLVQKANGLFIWASTACQMLKTPTSWDSPKSIYDSLMSADQPGDIDDVYALIFERTDPKFYTTMCSMLALLVAAFEPLAVDELDELLRLGGVRGSSEASVRNLGSVLTLDPSTKLIRFRHPTLVEYLRRRCTPTTVNNAGHIYIDIVNAHGQIASWCFKHLQSRTKGLRFNICEIESSFYPNSEIPDLEDRISKFIPRRLQYASFYWAFHVAVTNGEWRRKLKSELQYINKAPHTLYWMEILSVTKNVARGIAGLRALTHCADMEGDIKDRFVDIRRFMIAFSAPISHSAPHIYISALPFSPIKSALSIEGLKQRQNTLTVIQGLEEFYRGVPEALRGHQGPVLTTILSPDNSLIVSSSGDKTIRLWDADTGEQLGRPLQGHERWIRSIAISPDGSRIVSGSDDSTMRLWDVNSGQLVGKPLRGHDIAVNAVAFSPDGSLIASGSSDLTVKLWDAQSGRLLGEPLRGHQSWINAVAFSPNGSRIISVADGGKMLLWDTESGELLAEHNGITTAVFSPNGSQIACGLRNCTIQLLDAENLQPLGQLFSEGHKDSIKAIAFSPDGSRIISGDTGGTIRIWNTETCQMRGQAHKCLGCAISQARVDGNSAHLEEIPFDGHKGVVNAIAFTADGSKIVSGSGDKTIRLWDVDTGRTLGTPLLGHSSSVAALAFSQDGSQIVSGSYGGTIQLWNAHTGQPLGDTVRGHPLSDPLRNQTIAKELRGYLEPIKAIAFLKNGSLIFPELGRMAIQLCDAYTGQPQGESFQGHTRAIHAVAFSPGGSYIVSASYDNTIRSWDANTGQPFGAPVQDPTLSVRAVSVSEDGTKVGLGLENGTIQLRDIHTGQPIGEPIQGHESSISAIAFSSDGLYIVSGSFDTTVRVWDVNTGRGLGEPLRGHMGRIVAVVFSPDGLHIASSSQDKTMRIWDTQIYVGSNNSGVKESGYTVTMVPNGDPFAISVPGFEGCSLSHDGWVQSSERLLFWVPPENRHGLQYPHRLTIPTWSRYRATALDLTNFQCGTSWVEVRKDIL